MALKIQVTVDCAEPHVVADWWAAALEWEVEPQDSAFIQSMVDQGFASDADTMTHNGHLVWREGCAITSPDANMPRVLFQHAPEGKTVKNRVHFDLRMADGAEEGALEATRARVESMGAVYLHTASQGPHSWNTYQDPWGNEFCV